jgi:hypothetical protein
MTEAQARAALRAFVAVGEIERWIAEQPWEPVAGGGWTVPADLHGWRFRWSPSSAGSASSCPRTGEGRRNGPSGREQGGGVGRHEHGIRTAAK